MKKSVWHHSLKGYCGRIAAVLCFSVLVPLVAMAAEGGGHGEEGTDWVNFGWRVLDFIILVGLFYWLLASKVKSFFSGRREEIKTTLEEARLAKEAAEHKFKEYSEKLDKASKEIEGVYEMIRAQGQAEKEKILEDARKAAVKMKEDTQARIEQELKKASQQLRMEAVQLSVHVAEDILKRNITPEDHESMVKDYLDKVVRKH